MTAKSPKNVNKKIYLDYAATTPVDPRVIKKILPYLDKKFGNTMSFHSWGQEAKIDLEEARQLLAGCLGAKAEEIIFTSSATESNNLALKGIAFSYQKKGNHIIVSSIEHDCVLNSARWLESLGFKVSYLKTDKYGLVDPDILKKEITSKTILVSVMHANNEIGTVEPIEEIGKICRERGVFFHTDAAQTLGKIPIDVKKLNIDLLTGSSHKIYGPKGAGCLYIREGIKITPLLHGGGHEKGIRSSTVNVGAIVGFAEAVKIALEEREEEEKRIKKMRDKLIKGILKTIPLSYLNGHPEKRLYNNTNFRFDFIEGESIVFQLDLYGVAASTGSACSSKDLKPSHVLLALGLKPHQAHGSLRLSLGRWTKEEEIDYLLEIMPKIIKNLRKISPFKKSYR